MRLSLSHSNVVLCLRCASAGLYHLRLCRLGGNQNLLSFVQLALLGCAGEHSCIVCPLGCLPCWCRSEGINRWRGGERDCYCNRRRTACCRCLCLCGGVDCCLGIVDCCLSRVDFGLESVDNTSVRVCTLYHLWHGTCAGLWASKLVLTCSGSWRRCLER